MSTSSAPPARSGPHHAAGRRPTRCGSWCNSPPRSRRRRGARSRATSRYRLPPRKHSPANRIGRGTEPAAWGHNLMAMRSRSVPGRLRGGGAGVGLQPVGRGGAAAGRQRAPFSRPGVVHVDEVLLDQAQIRAITGGGQNVTIIPSMDGKSPVDIEQLAAGCPRTAGSSSPKRRRSGPTSRTSARPRSRIPGRHADLAGARRPTATPRPRAAPSTRCRPPRSASAPAPTGRCSSVN